MLSELDKFYLEKEKSIQICLLALRDIILKHNEGITAEWKYKLPFFYYKKKMLCYLWLHKKYKKPYIGFVLGSLLNCEVLLTEKRAKMKILLVDMNEDLPIEKINDLLMQSIYIYDKQIQSP